MSIERDRDDLEKAITNARSAIEDAVSSLENALSAIGDAEAELSRVSDGIVDLQNNQKDE